MRVPTVQRCIEAGPVAAAATGLCVSCSPWTVPFPQMNERHKRLATFPSVTLNNQSLLLLCSKTDIKKAFRLKAKAHHPDM